MKVYIVTAKGWENEVAERVEAESRGKAIYKSKAYKSGREYWNMRYTDYRVRLAAREER